MKPILKQKIGCWLHERWQTELVLLFPATARRFGLTWIDLCNRHERLSTDGNSARICLWQDSSFLTVARFFPDVGGRLLKHCLSEWPIQLTRQPLMEKRPVEPKVSVILPVGGQERLKQFQCVLKAFYSQTYRDLEIIVVEHGSEQFYKAFCPFWIRYIFLQRKGDQQFNKSMAMNEGIRNAAAPYVLFHDADVVPPSAYVESILRHFNAGWDAVRPMRFLFNLSANDSEKFMKNDAQYLPKVVELILQNFPGVSTAVSKEAYAKIGGHDEQFWGWGGEDLEFLDRLKTVHLFQGGYAPGIHLWHSSAPKKMSGDRNQELMMRKLEISPEERIKLLQRKRPTFAHNIS